MSLNSFSQFAFTCGRNRWLYFSVFLVGNSIISFLGPQLPFYPLFALGILFVALPIFIAWRTSGSSEIDRPLIYKQEFFTHIPWFIPLALFGICIFLRFYRLETLYYWPNSDEGWTLINAVELAKHWDWKFFYTSAEVPPLTLWAVAAMFKTNAPTFFSLWFPAAVVSCLTVASGYFAARQYFSKSLALIVGCLFGFSYWPLFIGRTCLQGPWLPLWVCLVLWVLGKFLKLEPSQPRGKLLILLGFFSGLGSFLFTPWPAVTFFILLFITWRFLIVEKKNWKLFSLFFGSLLISLVPFIIAFLSQKPGQHVASVAAWSGFFPWKHQIPVVFHYFTCLFWGDFDPNAAYTAPLWGFLNPILSAFFFLGILEALPFRKSKEVRWFSLFFLILLLPGLLTMNLEALRIYSLLPLLLTVSSIGFFSLLSKLPLKESVVFLTVVLLISGGMDFYELSKPLLDRDLHPKAFGQNRRSLERWRAYQTLFAASQNQGPGIILTDFDPDCPNDTTLYGMTYPFNAAYNPSLDPNLATWAAMFINVNYNPYLKDRLPGTQWIWLSQDLHIDDGGYMLALVPLTPENRKVIFAWLPAHNAFHSTNLLWYSQTSLEWDKILNSLQNAEALGRTDPFLSSVYWEKRAAYLYKKRDFPNSLDAYTKAINFGYPTAGLCYRFGDLLWALRDIKDAIPAFQKATQAPINYTLAAQAIIQLEHP